MWIASQVSLAKLDGDVRRMRRRWSLGSCGSLSPEACTEMRPGSQKCELAAMRWGQMGHDAWTRASGNDA